MRLVSISPCLPFPGIPHAGGEFYRRHINLLAKSHHVAVVAPNDIKNEKALRHFPHAPYRAMLIGRRSPRSRAAVMARRQIARAAPLLVARSFRRDLVMDERVLAELRAADCIELQWFEAVVLGQAIRELLPSTPIVGIFHDVVSQAYRRTLTAPNVRLKTRATAAVGIPLSVMLERRAMRTLDCAVVLSDKDRALLSRRGDADRIVVVSPPLDDQAMPPAPTTDYAPAPRALFVGALWRPENEDAALWLVDEIWPRVRASVPGALLIIAGAGPTVKLKERVARLPDVQLTDYVSDLGPYYQESRVALAPLRRGAGVKLKTVVAMLWGVPVVATRIGAEGVDGSGVFVSVVDDAEHFAEAVVRVLRKPESVQDIRKRAHAWAHQEYSTSAYRRQLDNLYRYVTQSPPPLSISRRYEPRSYVTSDHTTDSQELLDQRTLPGLASLARFGHHQGPGNLSCLHVGTKAVATMFTRWRNGV